VTPWYNHDTGHLMAAGRPTLQEMTGGEAVVEALKALGVRYVFGIVSVHNIPIYDAILRDGSITPIGVRHEQGAVHAADGYARVTGGPGVAIVSTGPGTTNAMTGLFEAGFASSPVLLITGQIDSLYYGKGKGFLHEAEAQLPMLRTVTRTTETVRRAEDIASTIVRLGQDAMTGRPQPCAVEIPVDLQYRRADVDVPHVEATPRVVPERAAISSAAAALSGAKRPLIWAGGGVLSAGAEAELRQLSELLDAPVVTSINGRGALPEDDPRCLGPLSNDPKIEPLIQEADVVLAVGTRFQGGATRNWAMSIPGRLFHLDADPAVIGRNYAASAIVGDARLGVAGILRALTGRATEPDWAARCGAARDAARAAIRIQIGPDYAAIMDIMRDQLPRGGAVIRDATVPAYLWGNRLLPILEPRTSLNPTSAAIGPALPLAIGAAIGSGRKAAVIQGDGGFMLNIAELATAVQYRVPVVVCVFNDGGYGVLRSIQGRTFEGRMTGVDLATPDFAMVARGMGVEAESVKGVDAFRAAYARAMAHDGPYLLDVDMSVLTPMGGLGTPPPRRG
jgi:acetolactate synthase-1/2/3 large subunit